MSKKTPQDIIQSVKNLTRNNVSILLALTLTVLATLFFLTIGYPNLFANLSFFRQRWFGLTILAASLSITYVASFYSNLSFSRGLSVWVQSNLLQFFSFAYFLRLNNSNVQIGQVSLTTGLSFIPLTLLIFFVNYNLFGLKEKKLYLVVPQVLLFCLQTLSFISFISVDRTDFRDFSQDWLSYVFNAPVVVWLILCAIAISCVSIFNLNLTKERYRIWLGLLFTFVVFQILAVIYNLNYTYWYQTLLFLVVWDFLFTPFTIILTKTSDSKYQPKLVISSIYHAFLFILILVLA